MPKQLESMPPRKGRSRGSCVDPLLATCTVGTIWHLFAGEDYRLSDSGMRAAIRTYAEVHDLIYKTRLAPDGLVLRFDYPAEG